MDTDRLPMHEEFKRPNSLDDEAIIDPREAAKSAAFRVAEAFLTNAEKAGVFYLSTATDLYKWNGVCLKETSRPSIEAEICRQLQSQKKHPRYISEIFSSLKMLTHRTEEELAANPLTTAYRLDDKLVRINFHNVVVVINNSDGSIDTEKHHPNWQFTRSIGCNYNPDAKCPLFQKVLVKSTPDEKDRHLLLSVLATALLPWQVWEMMLILFGPTNTGKSTLLGAVVTAFGKENTSAVNLEALGDWEKTKGRPMEMLEKSMLNVSLENKTRLISSDMMKAILSGEDVYCDPKFKKAQNKRTAAAFISATNTDPQILGATDADMKRIRILPMEQRIPNGKIDASIKQRLLSGEENEGIITLLLTYVPRVLRSQIAPFGGLRSEEIYKRFCVKIDSLTYFLNQFYEFRGSMEKSGLEEHFHQFLLQNGSDGISWPSQRDRMWKRIKNEHGIWEFRKTVDGRRVWFLGGVHRKLPQKPEAKLERPKIAKLQL